MKTLPYPPDGGLKPQVRDYSDTPSVFAVIRKHFTTERENHDIKS